MQTRLALQTVMFEVRCEVVRLGAQLMPDRLDVLEVLVEAKRAGSRKTKPFQSIELREGLPDGW